MRSKEFKVPLWDTTVLVCIGDDPDLCREWFEKTSKKHNIEFLEEEYGRFVDNMNSSNGFTICTPEWPYSFVWFPEDYKISTITHEAFHIVHAIMRRVGCVPLTESNEEAFAYTIGYVFNKIYEFAQEEKKVVDAKKSA